MQNSPHIKKMLAECQEEFKREFGRELTIEEIEDIINSQFHFAHSNMVKGEGTEIPFIGKFTTIEAKRQPRKNAVERKAKRKERIEELNAGMLTNATLDFRTLNQVQA